VGFGSRTRPKNVTVLATQNIRNKKMQKKYQKQKKSFSIFTFITNAKATINQQVTVVVQHSCLLEP